MSAALLEDVMVIYSYLVHPSTLSSHICSGNVHLLHPVGEGGRVDLPRSLVMSSSRLAARTVPFLPVKIASANPLEAKNFSNFFQLRKQCSY